MTTRVAPRFIALTPVHVGRQQDFERFLTDVVVPAVEKVSPALNGMWEVLLPAAPSDDARAVYGFVFYGDASLDDWDLPPLLTSAYGEEEGRRHFDQFLQFLAAEQVVHEFSGALARA